MATSTAPTWRLWSLILIISVILKGASAITNYTVGSVLVEPFLMEREEGHMGTEVEYEGFIPDLLHEIAQELGGVNFHITVQPDGKFGEKKQDGMWDGLVGSLSRREIDLAAGPLTITSRRHRVIEFGKPFLATGMVMVISGSPQDGSASTVASRLLLVLKPFTTAAWFMLIAGVLVIVIFAVIVHRLNLQAGQTASVSTILTTCSGGGRYSGCLLRLTMVNFVLLTLVLYTAGVVSLLLYTSRMENAQQKNYENVNIDDIVTSGEYKIAVVSSSVTKTFFRVSKVPLYERIHEMLTYVENAKAGFDLVHKDPGYAFITDRALVKYYMTRNPYCGLNIVGASLTSNGYGLGYPLNMPDSNLKDRINLAILNMRESGALQVLDKKWWNDRRQCSKPTVPSKNQLIPARPSIDSAMLGGVLIILLIGLLLSLGAGIVERFLRSSKGTASEGLGVA